VHRTTNQVIGLLVFLAGIALLIMVFLAAYRLYEGIGGEMMGVKAATAAPQVPGTPPAEQKPGLVVAQPGQGPGLATVLTLFAARLIALLVLGWLAAMLASRGAQLALTAGRLE
jgi:hypothetical protein